MGALLCNQKTTVFQLCKILSITSKSAVFKIDLKYKSKYPLCRHNGLCQNYYYYLTGLLILLHMLAALDDLLKNA